MQTLCGFELCFNVESVITFITLVFSHTLFIAMDYSVLMSMLHYFDEQGVMCYIQPHFGFLNWLMNFLVNIIFFLIQFYVRFKIISAHMRLANQ